MVESRDELVRKTPGYRKVAGDADIVRAPQPLIGAQAEHRSVFGLCSDDASGYMKNRSEVILPSLLTS